MEIIILLPHCVYLGEWAGGGGIEIKLRRGGINGWAHVGYMKNSRKVTWLKRGRASSK